MQTSSPFLQMFCHYPMMTEVLFFIAYSYVLLYMVRQSFLRLSNPREYFFNPTIALYVVTFTMTAVWALYMYFFIKMMV